MNPKPKIYVDGDGCPYKEEIYKVAKRYELSVLVVCNSPLRVPKASWIEPIVVGSHFDAVDDWICEHIAHNDIVITNDLLLAKRCIEKKSRVLDTRGRVHTEDSIGEALATRELMTQLRQMGAMGLGPKAQNPKYRSAFLRHLDEIINSVIRS